MGILADMSEASLIASSKSKSGSRIHPFADSSGRGSAVQEPLLLLRMTTTSTRYLPDRIDGDEHPGDQPGQNQYADDDRIGVTMDSLEHSLSPFRLQLTDPGPPLRLWFALFHPCADGARYHAPAPSGRIVQTVPHLSRQARGD